jgi:hypothetical protein
LSRIFKLFKKTTWLYLIFNVLLILWL